MKQSRPSNSTPAVEILDTHGGAQGVKVHRVRAVKHLEWAIKGPLNVNAGAGSATAGKSTLNLTAESIMHTEAF